MLPLDAARRGEGAVEEILGELIEDVAHGAGGAGAMGRDGPQEKCGVGQRMICV